MCAIITCLIKKTETAKVQAQAKTLLLSFLNSSASLQFNYVFEESAILATLCMKREC